MEKTTPHNKVRYIAIASFFVATATGLGWLFSTWKFPETNIAVVYILSIILTARFTIGYWYGIFATILSILAFNYFFTEPQFTLSVNDSEYFITFAIMASTSLITSALTASARAGMQAKEAIARERYRSNLLRSISHDLRTPLAGIMGASEMLLSGTDKTDDRYTLELGIYEDADRLHSLVENILNLTRLQEGRLSITKVPEPAEEIVGAAVNTMSKRAPDHDITVNMPDELLLVPMDARLIDQVIVNLLDNAVKHTPADKEICITVEKDAIQHMARFIISDQGTGIAPEDLPNIFETFYTTAAKGADAQYGVGLGLAICRSIIQAHGGKIFAQNNKSGTGAEFIFTLPLEVQKNGK